ncbi:MAG: peptidyl-prolyl cis-trans isomerase [Thermodesulfovibrionales bacterium]|nr:peptidyl-prolyl cis-trans isomerase [Thermodesulfovibrionales bacterium]
MGGCASLSQREAVLAVVDGEPITEEDLKYSLNIAHRKEDLSSAGSLNLSQYVQKLIEDRLIIDEARRSGMDQYPEVQQAIQAYILRESVVRLHDEEIVQKVFITEEEIKDYYFKVKRKEAPDEELEKVRGSIERAIRKLKEKERSDEYLKFLRERAAIKIDRELLSAINLSGGAEEIEKWAKDKRTLVEINGSVLTVGDFVTIAMPYNRKSNEDILNSWIDRKVVDQEALSRHYEMKPDLSKMLYRYENQLLKNTFIKRIIIPQIVVTEKILEDYYATHQKSFIKPIRYKIQQITVKSMEEAQDILSNLQNGADFSWVAKRKSVDSAAQKGGDAGWSTKAELLKPLREIIDSMKVGDSTIIEIESQHRIVKLIDKSDEEVEEFDKVKNVVYKEYGNEQVNALLEKYINQLKTDAQIKIYDEQVRSLEEKFKQ